MVKMVVGLGNPGEKYHETKHNIGFMVVDELAKQHNLKFNKSKFKSLYCEYTVNQEKIILVKPQTFMNESGVAVKPLMDYFKVKKDDLIIIYDDMDLPLGKIRLRQKGSAGGHNGVKSLIKHLQTAEFNRIKVGVGRPREFETVIQHVLSKFLLIDQASVEQSIIKAMQAIDYWATGETFLKTMNQFN